MSGFSCDAVVWLLATTGPDGLDEHRAYQLGCQLDAFHDGDHHARAAGETDRDPDAVPVQVTWPNTPARPQVACDRCITSPGGRPGALDNRDPHMWGRCGCSCHLQVADGRGERSRAIPASTEDLAEVVQLLADGRGDYAQRAVADADRAILRNQAEVLDAVAAALRGDRRWVELVGTLVPSWRWPDGYHPLESGDGEAP